MTVQFELQSIQKWRHFAGKPLGHIPSESAISRGLLNYLDPSHSGIKGFEPYQLHTLIKKAIVQEQGCNFAALRQISLYVIQFWGIARFVEIQSMKVGHLVRGVNHFDLVISRLGDSTAKSREVIPIYPTPTKFQKTFCPVFILSNYYKARHELCNSGDNDFLFPKMT